MGSKQSTNNYQSSDVQPQAAPSAQSSQPCGPNHSNYNGKIRGDYERNQAIHKMKRELNKIKRDTLSNDDVILYDECVDKLDEFLFDLLSATSDSSAWSEFVTKAMKKYESYSPESFQLVFIEDDIFKNIDLEKRVQESIALQKKSLDLSKSLKKLQANFNKYNKHFFKKSPESVNWAQVIGSIATIVAGITFIVLSTAITAPILAGAVGTGGGLMTAGGGYLAITGLMTEEESIKEIENSIIRMNEYLNILRVPIQKSDQKLQVFKNLYVRSIKHKDNSLLSYKSLVELHDDNKKLLNLVDQVLFGNTITKAEIADNVATGAILTGISMCTFGTGAAIPVAASLGAASILV
eukprot:CAMPEP_0196761034 /NCGR_PEP_ID=MMETSP1095-20130614/107_1 /TAXON_ID=96789 ORGANISM="Chromulina nebulosa, Strain UTEXLB2642" /NCGR_SAMPLE_ID=MMETSP1095 /ASSEMBLY_ACC=CAM_ASM_000446 /LENGTH=351 /DNA_ID=CAMNT_0042110051 /DNA_START=1 /DNA_END=1056 /DNA_ORIENTATION=-